METRKRLIVFASSYLFLLPERVCSVTRINESYQGLLYPGYTVFILYMQSAPANWEQFIKREGSRDVVVNVLDGSKAWNPLFSLTTIG